MVKLRLMICKLILVVCRLGVGGVTSHFLTCDPVRLPREVTIISKEKN